jgi:hypothetical protein
MRSYVASLVLLCAGAALVAFAVANALLLYASDVPRAPLNITSPLGQLRVQNAPDPYYLGVGILRGVLLLAIGVTGGKLIDSGLAELRERRRERAVSQYYEQYAYYQY